MKRIAILVAFALLLTAQMPADVSALSSVQLAQYCNGQGSVDIAVSWHSDPSAAQQYIDLSLENNGWLPGTFWSVGPLPGGMNWYMLQGAQSGAYFLRVSQQLPDGYWYDSETLYFGIVACHTAYGTNTASSVAADSVYSGQSLLDAFVHTAYGAAFAPNHTGHVAAYPNIPNTYVMPTCDESSPDCVRPQFLLTVTSQSGGGGNCVESYVNVCLEKGVDYDCERPDGTRIGDGPRFVRGPITLRAIGDDPYRLDRDRDGIGCEVSGDDD